MINAVDNAKTLKNVKKIVYIIIISTLNDNAREGLEKRVMHKILILVHSNLSYI